MKSVYGLSQTEFEEFFISNGEAKYKAIQVYEWVYRHKITEFSNMKNVSKKTISLLEENFEIDSLKLVLKQDEASVIKYLFELSDGNQIEAVLMKHDYGNSICISTQVGCNMGCAFCESGRLKKVRDLETHEMVLQIMDAEKLLGERISHVVIMGIGEPLDNYNNVIRGIDIINNDKGLAIGSRHITLSTVGIIPKINELATYGKQINLAVSLHTADDKLRNKLMSINKVYPIKELIEAVKYYISKTNRRVTFEYVMLKGVNDGDTDAEELSKLLRGINCYVNLIPYNATSYKEFEKSSKETILRFYDVLKKNKINVTIRREFGSKVSAACGQLRSNYKEE